MTGSADVMEMLSPLGESGSRPLGETGPNPPVPGERPAPVQEALWPAAEGRSVTRARDTLDALTRNVLEAIPARGAGPATIAVAAGLGVDAVMRSLGLLAAGGYVERCSRGWRIRPSPV